MGGKFLVFVMLYLMVDISLVLGYEGEFRINRPIGPPNAQGKKKMESVGCVWKTETTAAFPHQFFVACGTMKCYYHGDPTGCAWYTQNKQDFFDQLAGALKKLIWYTHDNAKFCNSNNNLKLKAKCQGVSYSKIVPQPPPRTPISEDLLWEDE